MAQFQPVQDGALTSWERDLKRDAERFGAMRLNCTSEAEVWVDHRTRRPHTLLQTHVVRPKQHPDGFQPAPYEVRDFEQPAPGVKPTKVQPRPVFKPLAALGRDAFNEGLEAQRQALQRLPGGPAAKIRDPGKPEPVHGSNPLAIKAEHLRRMNPTDRKLTIEAEAREAEAEKQRVRDAARALDAKVLFPHGVPLPRRLQTVGHMSAGVPRR